MHLDTKMIHQLAGLFAKHNKISPQPCLHCIWDFFGDIAGELRLLVVSEDLGFIVGDGKVHRLWSRALYCGVFREWRFRLDEVVGSYAPVHILKPKSFVQQAI
jgi:hypothetical protein